MDVCAGCSLAKWIRLQGYDVIEVRDRDHRMLDEDILKWAVEENSKEEYEINNYFNERLE
ncbi:MAG: DUF5615 family PIN-like protein [bacterium]